MIPFVQFAPVELRCPEGLFLLGVGNHLGGPSKRSELALPSLRDEPCQFTFVVGKILEGCRGCPLLTLKKHGHKWAQQHKRRGNFRTLQSSFMADSIADGAVTHLVVVL